MQKNQHGFSVVEAVIAILILSLIGFVGWKVFTSQKTSKQDNSSSTQNQDTNSSSEPDGLIWQQTADGWQSTQTPPACPAQPMLRSPVDLSIVTSILYPGQKRGTDYKPHGGFRFDNTAGNAVTVSAPLDGYIVRGSNYIAEGEVQYTFDIINNCGVMVRVGHIRELSASLQKIADAWLAPSASSATQQIDPVVYIKRGDTIGTKVGILTSGNTFFDLGVYDLRQENEASKSASYQSAHSQDKELSWHAVCWLNTWLPSKDASIIAKLPSADTVSGKTSDYCK